MSERIQKLLHHLRENSRVNGVTLKGTSTRD
jgi:hypothetical protein